jgi:hypothetical protein
MISGIDQEIGKIRSKLKQLGQDKNTVIILMGDNGYFLGERQLAGKWLMYENSIGVPLVIYDPRVGHHENIEEMALNIDIPATMLDLAGVEMPASWQGMSLLPLVKGKTNTLERDTILIEHLWERDDLPSSEGVRTAEWKYLRYINDKSAEELYHLQRDPKETQSLAEDPSHAEVLQELRNKCDQLVKKYRDPVLGLPGGLQVTFDGGKAAYSWALPGKGTKQRAFQVLVASSMESLEKNHGTIWDSRRVDTTSHQGIVHEGLELEAGKAYYWKVRIWDQDNRLTEYSEASEINV